MNLALLVPFALAAQPAAPISAPTQLPGLPVLSLEHDTMGRCSAAFAIVSTEQARGGVVAQWPVLGNRGREYYVRTGARIMDETGLGRGAVSTLFARSAQDLRAGDKLAANLGSLRAPCLALLDLAVPAG